MVLVNKQLDVDDAISRAVDVWELLVTDWGDISGSDPDGVNLVFPAIGQRALPAPAAIAIGPRSTIDRCWVIYDIEKIIPGPPFVIHPISLGDPIKTSQSSNLWDYTRRVSVGAPLSFSQPGNRGQVLDNGLVPQPSSVIVIPNAGYPPPGVAATMTQNYTNDLTNYSNKYLKADGTLATFGVGAKSGPGAQGEGLWTPPLLHLLFYLRPPVLPPPTKRFPLTLRYPVVQVSAGDAATEFLLAQVPIYGRRTVVINAALADPNGTPPAALPVRYAIIPQVGTGVAAGATVVSAPQESTVFTGSVPAPSAGNKTASLRTVIEPALGDWLMIYGTWAHAVAGVGQEVMIDIYAAD